MTLSVRGRAMLSSGQLVLHRNVATWLLGGVNYPMESLTVGRARGELGAVLENHDVLAVKPRLQFPDAIHVHDGRAMHAPKPVRLAALVQPLEGKANRMRLSTHVHLRELAVGFNPVDVARFDERHLAAGANHKALEVSGVHCAA